MRACREAMKPMPAPMRLIFVEWARRRLERSRRKVRLQSNQGARNAGGPGVGRQGRSFGVRTTVARQVAVMFAPPKAKGARTVFDWRAGHSVRSSPFSGTVLQ
jgi:hypothetical protein